MQIVLLHVRSGFYPSPYYQTGWLHSSKEAEKYFLKKENSSIHFFVFPFLLNTSHDRVSVSSEAIPLHSKLYFLTKRYFYLQSVQCTVEFQLFFRLIRVFIDWELIVR